MKLSADDIVLKLLGLLLLVAAIMKSDTIPVDLQRTSDQKYMLTILLDPSKISLPFQLTVKLQSSANDLFEIPLYAILLKGKQ
jgi:hypothetical protein